MSNKLIASLKPVDLSLIQPYLENHSFSRGSSVTYNETDAFVLFPTTGFFSVLVRACGRETEMNLVGREGLVGAPTILALDLGAHRAVARHDCDVLAVSADILRRLIAAHRAIAAVVLRYVRGVVSQLVHASVASAHLTLPQRLSYWLLLAADRADGAPLRVGHDAMATALGVSRAAVSRALCDIKESGAIRTGSRTIAIVDRLRLIALTDGVYGHAGEVLSSTACREGIPAAGG